MNEGWVVDTALQNAIAWRKGKYRIVKREFTKPYRYPYHLENTSFVLPKLIGVYRSLGETKNGNVQTQSNQHR